MVSTSAIAVIALDIVLGVLIPLLLAIFLHKKYACSWKYFAIGAASMAVFALFLESIVHNLFLPTPVGQIVQGNILFYGIYGGLMAGLFEETGRLVCFSTLLRGKENPHNALMYGAGHGGIEMMMILSLSMVNNLVFALLINAGQLETILAALPAEAAQQLEVGLSQLTTGGAGLFLISLWERISALIAQLSLSVLVFFAAGKDGKKGLYLLAVLLHAVLDFTAVYVNSFGYPYWVVETVVLILSLLIAGIAAIVWKRNVRSAEAA